MVRVGSDGHGIPSEGGGGGVGRRGQNRGSLDEFPIRRSIFTRGPRETRASHLSTMEFWCCLRT